MMPDSRFYTCADIRYDPTTKRVWMANGVHGVNYIDDETDQLVRFAHPKLKNLTVLKIELINGIVYIGTLENGLLRLDPKQGSVESVGLTNPKSPNVHLNYAIRSLHRDGTVLWIGTEGDGLKKLDTQTGSVAFFNTKTGSLKDDKVWAVVKDDPNHIWVGTDGGGATYLNINTQKATHHIHSEYNNATISSNTIRAIHRDNTGDLWFGTFNGGFNYLPNFSIKFHVFRKNPEDPTSLGHNAVLCFYEKTDGTVFIGTDGGGLYLLKDGKFSKYRFPKSIEEPKVILSIRELETGGLLLGTYQQGLYYITKTNQVRQFKHNPNDKTTITCNIIWDIDEDYEGNAWLATEVGVNRFDPYTFKFTHFKNDGSREIPGIFTSDFTQTILIDSSHTVWTGFFGEVRAYDLTTQEFWSFPADSTGTHIVPNKQILSLSLDPTNRNTAWCAGFGAGLMKIDLKKKHLKLIDKKEGLPNDLVFAVQADRQGKVWLSSNVGLIRYDPIEKNFFVFKEEFGVDIDPYKDNAGYITTSGYVLFGGTNGFTAFWPRPIQFEKTNLNVTFTGFRLFAEEVPIDNVILSKSITETEKITLDHEQARFMTFEFSAPHFLTPSTLEYQYMLEGFEDTWRVITTKEITFTNLLPGRYKLRVKAGFASGVTGRDSVLQIIVIPAWWMTWYARVAGLLLFIGLGYSFYRYRVYRLNKRKLELERIVNEQNQEILLKNDELAAQNEELSIHNERLVEHQNTISVQNKLLQDAQGQLKEINHSLETQVQLRTEKLNDTIVQLNKTIKELDAFLYSASHDLASPLKSILGLVNLAKREQIDPTTLSYLDHIEKSVRKLEGVIHTLMQHSFNTKAEAQIQRINLKEFIQETIQELDFMDETKEMAFTYCLDDARVIADPTRLKIILSNLISNSIKYRDPKKPSNIVEFRFGQTEHTWTLEISDNGIGIEQSRLERVFDMFYRATESAKGSGLGLYIVKDTVERLGGKIEAHSEFGRWTKFILTFPVKVIDPKS
jgi:signal transduction histidine kinase/ligand-binding sensor domain-containing protein